MNRLAGYEEVTRLSTGGHRIDYFPRLSEALGCDAVAAICLQQFVFWSDPYGGNRIEDDDGWFECRTLDSVRDLGVTRHQLARVKRKLVDLGLIETRTHGMPRRCQVRLMPAAVQDFLASTRKASTQKRVLAPHLAGISKIFRGGYEYTEPGAPDATDGAEPAEGVNPESGAPPSLETVRADAENRHTPVGQPAAIPTSEDPKQEKTNNTCPPAAAGSAASQPLSLWPEENLTSSVTYERIVAGDFDAVSGLKAGKVPAPIQDALMGRWRELWGKPRAQLTPDRKRALKRALAVYPLSEFAKALEGMRYDQWPERRDHCDWKYITRDIERWSAKYQAEGHAMPSAIPTGKTKVCSGVTVPFDYEWTNEDDVALSMGLIFDFEGVRWVVAKTGDEQR